MIKYVILYTLLPLIWTLLCLFLGSVWRNGLICYRLYRIMGFLSHYWWKRIHNMEWYEKTCAILHFSLCKSPTAEYTSGPHFHLKFSSNKVNQLSTYHNNVTAFIRKPLSFGSALSQLSNKCCVCEDNVCLIGLNRGESERVFVHFQFDR